MAVRYVLIFIICIAFFCQSAEGNSCVPQSEAAESAVMIRPHKDVYFSVQLFKRFTEEGCSETICVARNGKPFANINLPSSEDVKNLKAKIRKYRKGCVLECLYGGGDNLYSRHFYFKSIGDNLYLYKVKSAHIVPNARKSATGEVYVQPLVDIGRFSIMHYLENTP